MSNLRELQENFQDYILNNNEKIVGQLTDLERMSAKDRADVYKNGYSLRLLEIMSKDFPRLKEMMGEEAFEKMGREYIAAYPSNHFNIVLFDRHMNQFMSTYENVEPVHIEMAAFEWKMSQALIAADAPQLTVEDLAAIPPDDWGNMKLEFHPSVSTIELFTNAPLIFRAYEEETEIPEITNSEESVNWMIWRFEKKSYFVSLNEHRFYIYNAIREGKTFGDICEGLTEWLEEQEVAEFAAFTLRDWFLEGVISSVTVTS